MSRLTQTFFAVVSLFLASSCSTLLTTSFIDSAGLSPYARYDVVETAHFEITYLKGYSEFAHRAAQHLEHAHQILSPLLKWKPRGKTHVLIIDNDDSANGFAAPPLRIGMVLYATPPDSWFSTAYSDDWIKLLVFHEYVHILNIDPTTEWMEWVRILYGDIVRPNGLWPSWMIEGLAVYYETRLSRRGRGRSPYYDGLLRALIEEKKLNRSSEGGITVDRINGPFPGFPGGEIPYLFGYQMWQELALSQITWPEAEDLMGELSIRSSARVPYFINGNLNQVFGTEWDQVWNQWVDRTEKRLGVQLDDLQKQGVTPFMTVTDADFSALGATVSPDLQWLAYTRASTDRRTGLYVRNLTTSKEYRISDKVQGVSQAFSADSKYVLWSSLNQYRTYQSFSDLWITDLQTQESQQLSHGWRAKDPTLHPDQKSLAFIKVEGATHHLWQAQIDWSPEVKISKPRPIYHAPLFTILGTPRFLPDGRIVFSEQKIGESQSTIRVLNPAMNEVLTLLADGYFNRSLAVTPQGKIIFVSDRSGVDNLYEIAPQAIASQESAPPPRLLTNVTTGLQLPFVDSKGLVYVSRLSAQGYQIGTMNILGNPNVPGDLLSGSPTAPTLAPHAPPTLTQALETPETPLSLDREYSPWSSLAPRQWAPLAGFSYSSVYGSSLLGTLAGFDSTGVHQYYGMFSYQFKSGQFDPTVSYSYYGMRPRVSLTAASDTFNFATTSSRQTYKRSQLIEIAFDYPIRGTFSQFNPSIFFSQEWNGVFDLNTGARVASKDIDYNRSQIPSVGAVLRYRDIEQSRFGFMPERGQEWTLAGLGRKYDRDYALWKYLISYRRYIPITEHSVLSPRVRWLGSSRTLSTADRFYAQGRGKSSSDVQDRGTGASLDALGLRGYLMDGRYRNRAIGITSLDYHFPIARIFSGSGTLPFFWNQAFGFVFFDTAMIENVFVGRQFLPSFGGGLSFSTTVLLQAPIQFNLEYQQGTRQDLGGEKNIVLSVQSGLL